MKLLFGILLSVVFVVSVPAQQRNDAIAEQRIDAWQHLLEGKQWAAVADSCHGLLSERPMRVSKVLQARAWSIRGRALRQLGSMAEAIVAHRKALALRLRARGRLHEETASSYLHLGNCLLQSGRIDEAASKFENSLHILKKLHPKGHPDIGTVYNSLAQCYWAEGRLHQAEHYLQSALSVASQYYPSHAPQVVEGLFNLASFYSEQLRFDTAVALLQQARFAQEQGPILLPGDKIPVLNILASTFARQGRIDLAVATWRQAASMCDQDFTTPLRIKGDCLHNLGLGLLDLGDYPLAEIYLLAALNCFTDDPLARGSIYNGLGLTNRYRNDVPTALRWFREAQNAYQQAGYDNIPWLGLAGVYQNIGACYLEQKALYPAKFFLQKSQNIFKALPNGQTGTLTCWLKLAACFDEDAQPDSAAYCLKQAQKLVKNAGTPLVFALHFQWGEWHFHQKNWAKALASYQKAAGILGGNNTATGWMPYTRERIRSNVAISQTWQQLAFASGNPADWRRSLQYAEAATAVFRLLRSELRGQDAGAELQQEFFAAYDLAVEAWLALGDERQAFAASEASKSNFLQQLTASLELQRLMQTAPERVTAERQCNYRLEYFQKRRFDLTNGLLPGQYDAPSIAALDDSIRRAENEKQVFQNMHGPGVYAALTSDTLPFASLQHALSPRQTMLVYHWGEERLVLFVVQPNLIQAFRIPLSDSLTGQINRFYRLCSSEPEIGQQTSDYEDFVRIGQQLFQTLVGPAQPWLHRELLLVPDGLLWYVPFDAMLTRPSTAPAHRFRQHPYVCREYSIQYVQSAGLWNVLRKQVASPNKFELLALAPGFDHNSMGLRPLHHNSEEAMVASKIFNGKYLTGKDATEQRFTEEAGQYRVLLLSTHGQLNDRVPNRSYVAFTQYPDSVENIMYVAEINNLELTADLVILSACQTATGKLYRGEGLMSITRAFQLAGAKALTASQWDVTDSKSPYIITTFLKALKSGQPKPEALAHAQCAYLDAAAGMEAHPYYWAGFVSCGNEGAIFEEMKLMWLYLACGIMLLLCCFLLYFKRKERKAT